MSVSTAAPHTTHGAEVSPPNNNQRSLPRTAQQEIGFVHQSSSDTAASGSTTLLESSHRPSARQIGQVLVSSVRPQRPRVQLAAAMGISEWLSEPEQLEEVGRLLDMVVTAGGLDLNVSWPDHRLARRTGPAIQRIQGRLAWRSTKVANVYGAVIEQHRLGVPLLSHIKEHRAHQSLVIPSRKRASDDNIGAPTAKRAHCGEHRGQHRGAVDGIENGNQANTAEPIGILSGHPAAERRLINRVTKASSRLELWRRLDKRRGMTNQALSRVSLNIQQMTRILNRAKAEERRLLERAGTIRAKMEDCLVGQALA